jgi:hypothetical protein
MLFAMHIFAVQFLLSKGAGDPAKRRRWMSGLAVSGFLAVLLGAVLKVIL